MVRPFLELNLEHQSKVVGLICLATLGLASLLCLLSGSNVAAQTVSHPPIAVRFHLDKPGFVTLVLEDQQGQRVRNLLSEAFFPAGDNVTWWDGLDDLGRDLNSAAHAVYNVPGKFIAPGTYIVRGLYHDKIDLKYEFSIYNPGQPPWMTSDPSSEWLTNHTPADAVCFIPAGLVPVHGQHDLQSPEQVLIGSYVAEGGSGLAWVDLDGKKLHGQMWVGGVWTGAQYIARDLGSRAQQGVYAYVASSWKGELRLHKLIKKGGPKTKAIGDAKFGYGEDVPALNPNWKFPKLDLEGLGGLAAYNGVLIVSLPKMNELLLIDVGVGRVIGTYALTKPGGLFADEKGSLYVVSETRVLKLTLPDKAQINQPSGLSKAQIFIGDNLEQPQQIAMDPDHNLYVSDWGTSNQVKVFSSAGKFLRAIGDTGPITSGPYDPKLMHHPKGVTIDNRNRLWVAEEDFQPKRVSIWDANGHFVRAFYGPPTYGGGGNLDPKDKTLFYLNGMTFRLDWKTGESTLTAIQYRLNNDETPLVPTNVTPERNPLFQESGSRYKKFGASENPDFPIYLGGRKYFTNAYNSDPTTGTPVVGLWISKGNVAVPVAAFGRADYWQPLQNLAFRTQVRSVENQQPSPARLPNLSGLTFAWSDLNGDGTPQPAEVTLTSGTVRTVTVSTSLELVTDTAMSYKPVGFNAAGIPLYDLSKGKPLAMQTQRPASSGGGQVLSTAGTWTILTTAPKPFAPQSLSGAENGVAKWSYPSLWPGLHASHSSPPPEFPGELIGTTRVLGPSFQLHNASDVELWAINGNKGTIYLFTTDGLFVTTLFKDSRSPTASWAQRPRAIRGMFVSDLTLGEENFWPSITQTEDGQIYVVTNFPSIIRVDGLDTIHRIAPQTIHVTTEQLAQCKEFFIGKESARQRAETRSDALIIPVRTKPLRLDGRLAEWDPNQFVTIDERTQQQGDWQQKKAQTAVAMRIAGDRLYVALKTSDAHALDNSGASLPNLFKTGGAFDLMLGTDPSADPQRKSAGKGDLRLLVALVKGRPVAVLYRPVASGGQKNSTLFESPLRTIRFDDVEDVSHQVELVRGGDISAASSSVNGDVEFSISLDVLGLKPAIGRVVRGDIGVLRGDGQRTVQRVYWSNKATGLVSDIPSEAELTPQLWGTFKFVLDAQDQSRP